MCENTPPHTHTHTNTHKHTLSLFLSLSFNSCKCSSNHATQTTKYALLQYSLLSIALLWVKECVCECLFESKCVCVCECARMCLWERESKGKELWHAMCLSRPMERSNVVMVMDPTHWRKLLKCFKLNMNQKKQKSTI
jgi:hypothetical protein